MAERVKKVTMEDIAVKMNVSRALVSYAWADKYGVSEEMKKQMKMVMNQSRGKKGRFRFPPMR